MEYRSAKILSNLIKKHAQGLYLTGSLKRKEPVINDIDFITIRPIQNVYDQLKKFFGTQLKFVKGDKKYMQLNIRNVPVDIWHADTVEELLLKRFLRDVDKGHAIGLHKKANKKGYRLTEKGLFDKDGKKIQINNVQELHELLSF